MLKSVDVWILDRVFQRAADDFQARYGKTNFWLAATCALFAAGFILADALWHQRSMLPVLLTLGLLVLGALCLELDGTDEEMRGVANPRRNSGFYRFIRLGFIAISIGKMISMTLHVFNWSLDPVDGGIQLGQSLAGCGLFYFASCTSR